MAFLIENETSEQCHWILHIRIPVGTRLHLKLIILTFLTKLAQKGGVFDRKQKKWIPPLYSVHSNWFRLQILWLFLIKNRNSENHHYTLDVRISVGTKFHLKLIFLTFWTKFSQKRYFQSKAEKVNITIESCKFESV